MATTPDFAKMMQDAAAAMGMDSSKMKDALANSAGYGEKLSKLAIGAAERSAAISEQYARETLAKLGEVAKAKDSPAEYSTAMAEFLTAQTHLMQSHLSAFTEIAHSVQAEAGQLMMSAAHSASAEAAEAMQKAAMGLMAASDKVQPKK